MHGGVGADETLLPVFGRTLGVMPVKRLLIVGTLVPEDFAEGIQLAAVGDQPIPEIVSYLMTEMSQKRAIGFFLERALLLAMHIVRLGNVDGNQSIVVPGQHAPGVAIRGIL